VVVLDDTDFSVKIFATREISTIPHAPPPSLVSLALKKVLETRRSERELALWMELKAEVDKRRATKRDTGYELKAEVDKRRAKKETLVTSPGVAEIARLRGEADSPEYLRLAKTFQIRATQVHFMSGFWAWASKEGGVRM